jgi:hypothetical protein
LAVTFGSRSLAAEVRDGRRWTPVGIAIVFFVSIAILRVWGIETHFWLLRDQIRDWDIALRPFADLPLVGPATHVGGYTIGPAFYWILWAIRVTLGPWFDNLPHAGGIGQALLQSAADALLLVAIWRRTASPWIAIAAIVLVSTAAYDLCLAALVWNPTMGSNLAKFAMALILLDWHRSSAVRAVVVAAIAWSAVHAYTGAVFVTVGVFAALVAVPLLQSEWIAARRNAAAIAVAVAVLQLPYVAHQVTSGFRTPAMGAVSGSLARVATGQAAPEIDKSVRGYVGAVEFIQANPWRLPFAAWVLVVCGGIVAARHARDPVLLSVVILPPLLAIAGYALFLDDLDNYYYLSLMPSAVLIVVLGVMALVPRRFATHAGIALVMVALAMVPARVRVAATMHRMPEYGVLVVGARQVRARNEPMRAVRAAFPLPPTSNAEFVYRTLGGRIDRSSPWVAVISPDGSVTYRHDDGS